jgi:hypothetical protein
MQRTLTLLTYFLLITNACSRKNFSPGADPFYNGTGGFWKLSGYSVNGTSTPVSEAEEHSLLQIKKAIVTSDDHFTSSKFRTGMAYRIFEFSSNPLQKGDSAKALSWGESYNRHDQLERIWYKIDDDTGFQSVLEIDISNGIINKMLISNIMKSSEYAVQLDTIRYSYIPTDDWR